MNARWLKQNLGVLIFGVVLAAALGFLGWKLHEANAEQEVVLGQINTFEQARSSLRSKPVFPDKNNIRIVESQYEKLQQLYGNLHRSLSQKNVTPPEAVSHTDFVTLLSSNVLSLGPRAKEGGLAVPEKFRFGFSRYEVTLPCWDPSVNREDCMKLLGKELVIVDRLVALMITNRVDSLAYIKRAEAEPGVSNDAIGVPVTRDPLTHYTLLPFEIRFVASPDAFQKLVQSLLSSEWNFAIRNLQVDPEGTTNTENPADTSRRRLTVTMRFDVIEFPQTRLGSPRSAGATKPAPRKS